MSNKTLKAIGLAASLACSVAAVTIVTGCAGDANSRSTGTYIDDTAVSTKVKSELIADKDVKARDIKVRTYSGEVQLSGFVNTPEEKTRAVQIARAVPGVQRVRDDLVLRQPTVSEAAGAQTPTGAPIAAPNGPDEIRAGGPAPIINH